MRYLELLVGMGLLFAGGDLLVRGAASIAMRLKIPPLIIGLTVVGFATSMPELFTSLTAAFAGSPGIAIGNVVGSNTANVLLILGLAALTRPLTTSRDSFVRGAIAVILVSLICVAIARYGSLDRPVGLVLLLLLAAYVIYTLRTVRPETGGVQSAAAPVSKADAGYTSLPVAIPIVAIGLVLTLLGAKLAVDSAIAIAIAQEIDEAIVGLTVVAVGTSLPELAASVMAAVRRNADIAIGNVIGSNIFNILGILGATALVRPIGMGKEIAQFDIWVMLGAAIYLLPVGLTGGRISRGEGATFVCLYAAYLAILLASSR